MIVLLDTDVLIDVALNRLPYAEPAAGLIDKLEQQPGNAYVAWHSIANFYYMVRFTRGSEGTKNFILELIQFTKIAKTDTHDLKVAIQLNMKDFEDAMQTAAALACNAAVIATRNIKDYKNSPVPAVTPADLMNAY